MVWAGNTAGSHLVWTGVVIGPASDHEELSSAAGHGRRADRLLHGGHLCPAVGEGVVALDAIEAGLAVVAAHRVHLRAQTHVTHPAAGKANCGLKVSTWEKVLIIKRISWWQWTRASTLAFKEPAFQVNNDVFLKKQYYLWPCLPFPGNYYRQSQHAGATFSKKLPATWFMCSPQLLLYYYITIIKWILLLYYCSCC